MTTNERCPVCDRPEATADQWARVERDENIPAAEGVAVCWGEGEPQCVTASVDWRARALAAEAERDEANAARDTLRERVAEEIGLRLDGHGDDDLAAEAGEVRRERDEARRLLAAAARGELPRCGWCVKRLATRETTERDPQRWCDACDAADLAARPTVARRDLPHAAALRAALGGAS